MNLLLHCETDTKASAFRKPTLVKKSLAVSTGEKLLNVQNCKQLMEEDGGGGQDIVIRVPIPGFYHKQID